MVDRLNCQCKQVVKHHAQDRVFQQLLDCQEVVHRVAVLMMEDTLGLGV